MSKCKNKEEKEKKNAAKGAKGVRAGGGGELQKGGDVSKGGMKVMRDVKLWILLSQLFI